MSMHVSFDTLPRSARRGPDDPFRILLLADLLGDADAGPFSERRILKLDIDRFDSMFSGLAPQLQLADGEVLEFTGLDDFHPDVLYRRLPALARLRELRQRLRDPQQAAGAIAELATDQAAPSAPAAEPEEPGSDLERLLGGRPLQSKPALPGGLDRLLHELVQPHVVSSSNSEPYLQAVEQLLTEQLRARLHQPDFQTLEANWRGLWWLLGELPDTPELQLHVLPVSRAELESDLLAAGGDIRGSTLYRLLFETGSAAPDQGRWALLSCLHPIRATESDVQLLAALGVIATGAGAALLAAADPGLAGCRNATELSDPDSWQALPAELETRWQALRRSAVAERINLCLPRLLLRQPYGKRSDPISSFTFEELPPGHGLEQLLWANPALGTTLALSQGFVEDGWEFAPGRATDLEDLPAWHYSEAGETRLQPCAEVLLSERVAGLLLGLGLTPLLSYRDSNKVRLPGCLALSGSALAGPWS